MYISLREAAKKVYFLVVQPLRKKGFYTKFFRLKQPYFFYKYCNKPAKKTRTLPTENII